MTPQMEEQVSIILNRNVTDFKWHRLDLFWLNEVSIINAVGLTC